MKISRDPSCVHWRHPEFGYADLYASWCGFPRPPAPVNGAWHVSWHNKGPLGTGINTESGGRDSRIWVGSERIRAALQQDGFSNVEVIGMPAVYLPDPQLKRESKSLLLLLKNEASGLAPLKNRLEHVLASLRPHESGLARITIGLCEGLYQSAREWIWELRTSGLEVIPFEENPNCVFSLREAAALFASYEFVSGNVAGHWLPHAALRGARVSLLPGAEDSAEPSHQESLPEWLFGPPLEAPDSLAWGASELGLSARRSPAELTQLFDWHRATPKTQSLNQKLAKIFEGHSAPPKTRGLNATQSISVTLEMAPHQLVEEACRENRWEAIIDTLKARLSSHPQDLRTVHALTLFHLIAGQQKEALPVLIKYTDGLDLYVPLVVLLIELLATQQKYSEAQELFKRAITHNADHPALFLAWGRVLTSVSKIEAAKDFFSLALDSARHYPSGAIWPHGTTGSGAGRILLVSCSAKPSHEQDSLSIVRSFRLNLAREEQKIDLDVAFSNTNGLPEVYNAKLEEAALSGYEFVVFVHDDVFIEDSNLASKLRFILELDAFHLIGVAGGTNPEVKYPSLWHIMCGSNQRRGFLSHNDVDEHLSFMSSYGPSPAPVDLLDGVFIAVHVPSVMSVGWRWNEQFRFHHYDLAGSLDAKEKGLRLGVAPLHLIHTSPGLDSLSDTEWASSDAVFLKLYEPASGPNK